MGSGAVEAPMMRWQELQQRLHPTRHGPSRTRHAIEGDIKGCFDAIDHHVLMERVRKRIKDRKVLRLILAFLKADIMIEGALRHPVTGTPQGGIISPLLANVCLTAIDQRYGRWSPRPGEEAHRATDRRKYDRKLDRPTFYAVRYADDFVVFVEGTVEQAEAERGALAEFLQRELRMELSMEKTRITDVGEGFDFLGYRVTQEPALHTGKRVGKLFIPKSKLKQLRHTIKVKVRGTPTGRPLADLIDSLNPIITGWRNYYRYAGKAWREFAKLDWWVDRRIAHWVRRKHNGATWKALLRQYRRTQTRGTETLERWNQEIAVLQRRRDIPLPRSGHPDTERMGNRTEAVVPAWRRPLLGRHQHPCTNSCKGTRGNATHGEPDAGKLARPVRGGG